MKKILFDRHRRAGAQHAGGVRAPRRLRALRKALGMTREDVLDSLMDSGIRQQRGAPGSRWARKLSFLPHGDMAKYLVCNADESEPGTLSRTAS